VTDALEVAGAEHQGWPVQASRPHNNELYCFILTVLRPSKMSDVSLHTTMMHAWVDRIRSGDRSAQDELIRSVCGRLEALARKMLRDFSGVKRYEGTEDVLQGALMRLMRALPEVRPDSMREFYALAATQIRRELLDLARRYFGPQGDGANCTSLVEESEIEAPQAADADLEKWQAFHQHVEKLPTEERDVVGLVFYHGWTQGEVADFFQVSERTVRRYWQSALRRLHDGLKSYR